MKTLFTLNLNDGFKFGSLPKKLRVWTSSQGTERISRASGHELFLSQRNNLRCVACNVEATEWRAVLCGQVYSLNLFANQNGKLTLMTQDHIIPASLGGSNELSNLRVMCQHCNVKRGNKVTIAELLASTEVSRKLPNAYMTKQLPITVACGKWLKELDQPKPIAEKAPALSVQQVKNHEAALKKLSLLELVTLDSLKVPHYSYPHYAKSFAGKSMLEAVHQLVCHASALLRR